MIEKNTMFVVGSCYHINEAHFKSLKRKMFRNKKQTCDLYGIKYILIWDFQAQLLINIFLNNLCFQGKLFKFK